MWFYIFYGNKNVKEKRNKKVKKKTSENPLGRHVVSPLFVIILIFLLIIRL